MTLIARAGRRGDDPGGFRHVIVLEGGDAVGILSMRDIVRCWLSEGASCDVATA